MEMRYYFLIIILAGSMFLTSCGEKIYKAKIETEHGNIIVELFNDTPLHRDNFVKLAKENFYENLLFHRVMYDFMIQGGDPNSRDSDPGEDNWINENRLLLSPESILPIGWHMDDLRDEDYSNFLVWEVVRRLEYELQVIALANVRG